MWSLPQVSGSKGKHFPELGPYPTVLGTSLVAQTIETLSAMQETRVQSLGREDPLEKRMATHPSILAQRIPWTEDTIHGVAKMQTN